MNQKALFLFILLSFICIKDISAQVSGIVTDSKQYSLSGFTLVILNAKDSAYVTGTITDIEGKFCFEYLQPKEYVLRISAIGFKNQDINIYLSAGKQIEPMTIVMEEDTYLLSAITVTGKRNTVSVEAGKTTIDIASSVLGSQGNALDALKKLPGVIIRDDGTMVLNGQAGANVMIDNKPTYVSGETLLNLLRSMPAASVNKIELITHPSSRYDAAGNSGIINIQSRKTAVRGINLSISSSTEKGKYIRGGENISLNVRHNRLNAYIDYSYYWGNDFGEVVSSRYYSDLVISTPSQLRQDMDADRKMRYGSHLLRGGVDYDFSAKLSAGVYVFSNWLNRRKDELSVSEFYNNMPQSDSVLTTVNEMDFRYKNITGGANILYKLNEKGEWNAAFDYQQFSQGDDQIQRNVLNIPLNQLLKDTLTGHTTGDIKIYSGQSNLSYQIYDKHKLSTGLKSVFVNIGSGATYKNLIADSWHKNDKLSSSFHYDENINAIYLQMNSNWSTVFSTEIGLRLENTNVKSGYGSGGIRDSVLNQNYTHLFPNFTAQYALSENHSVSFLFGKRIIRPNYRDLNPFVEINNPFLYDKGNTELKPELIDNLEISWLFKKQFGFNVFYSHRKNPITKSYLVEEGSRILVMPMNLSQNHSTGIRLGLNNLKPFYWWTAHINSSLIYKQFDWIMLDEKFRNEVITPTVHLSNQLSLPYGWSAEVMGYYNGMMVEGQAKIHPLWQASVGVRKNLFDNRFSLYIYANDIFLSNRYYINFHNNYLSGWYKEKRDSRMFGVTLTYRFNRGNDTKNTRRDSRIDESNRINM